MRETLNKDRPAGSLFLNVARATVRRAPPKGGKPLVQAVGDDLAEVLARELADQLASVVPAAIVETISGDLLEGADAIAVFVYGSKEGKRKVYHLVQQGRFPCFRLGTTICARKSAVLEWIKRQEIAGPDPGE